MKLLNHDLLKATLLQQILKLHVSPIVMQLELWQNIPPPHAKMLIFVPKLYKWHKKTLVQHFCKMFNHNMWKFEKDWFYFHNFIRAKFYLKFQMEINIF